MSDVGSDRLRNTQGFLTKNVKEIFWDLKFLSEVTGCQKTQVSDRTGVGSHRFHCISYLKGRHGRDRMVIGFTTTCATSAYNH